MKFYRSTYYPIPTATWTPKQLLVALVLAFRKANGEGRKLVLVYLKYVMTDGTVAEPSTPRIEDFTSLATIPPEIELEFAAVEPEDANVGFCSVAIEGGLLRLFVKASEPQNISEFLNVLNVRLSVEPVPGPEFAMGPETLAAMAALRISTFQPSQLPDKLDSARPTRRTATEKPGSSDAQALAPSEPLRAATPSADLINVLIYTALKEERDVVEQLFGLRTAFEDGVARGVRNGVNIELISGTRMGRVPAAVAVTHHLASASHPYRLVVLAGIAGGFEESQIATGTVIIASEVVDLATRKMDDEPQFRPLVFTVDDTAQRFADSDLFAREEWELECTRNDQWPNGRRPYIKVGPIASLDEVVSNDEWRYKLRAAWPKLLGVEMEAGGVCAAAERFRTRVVIIRGVSDMADPRKSDDQWRALAMKAVVRFSDRLIRADVLKRRP